MIYNYIAISHYIYIYISLIPCQDKINLNFPGNVFFAYLLVLRLIKLQYLVILQ